MAYVGEVPWHGLGQCLDENASIETWVEEAGMAWDIVRRKPMYYTDRAQTQLRQMEDKVILTRSDNGNALGIVGADYVPVQPRQVIEFFRDLVSGQGFKLHTAGTLFGGSRFWALAKITEATFSGWDKVGGFLLLSSSADGSRATEARETTVRVVCNNTLQMAFGEQPANIIRVTHRDAFNPEKIKEQMGLSREHFETFAEAANLLSRAKVSEAAAEQFVLNLLRPGAGLEDEESRRPRGLDTILGLFHGGGQGSMRKGSMDTAWGLVNAVTEYVDHHATAKSVDHLLDRALWGSGNALKTQAMTQALVELV
jgi:phage/plasmid-like protein (TIGR03299 family)